MRSVLYLRIASVLTFFHFAAHTIGGVLSGPHHGAEETVVLQAMKAHQFAVMGASRSYWDFYFGYGLFVSVNFLVQAVLFWQLASLARTNGALIRPIVALFFVCYAALAVVAWKYFFIAPLAVEVLIAVCLALAYASLRPAAQA